MKITELQNHLDEISELYINREPSKNICEKYQISRSTLSRFLKKNNLENKRKPYEDITDKEYGEYIAVSYIKKVTGKKGGINHLWKCQCKKCKNFTTALIGNLKKHKIRKGCKICRSKELSITKKKTKIPTDILSSIKSRTLKNEYDNDLTPAFLWDLYQKQDGKCKISGVSIDFKKHHTEKNTASLDRIDSSKGYLQDNVQWVHKKIQSMKNNMTDYELIDWCSKVYKYSFK